MNTRFKVWMGVKIVLGITAFVIIFGFGTMYLWNWLVPLLFHGPIITFWQTVGLLILSKILFGGFGKKGGWGKHRHGYWDSHRHSNWKAKMKAHYDSMSPEKKEQMKNRCKGWYTFDDEVKENTTTTEQ